MKVIKKSLKVALCFSAIAATGIACAVSPSISAYATLSQGDVIVADEIKALAVPTSVDATKSEPFVIPTLKGVSQYSIKVYDTADQVHTWNVDTTLSEAEQEGINTDADKEYFAEVTGGIQVNYLNNGEYKVVYVVDGVYSHIYRVQVKNLSYELSFENANGLKQLVKPTVAVSSETNDTKWVKLPTATVNKLVDGESVDIADPAELKIYVDGTQAVMNSSEPEKGTWQQFASIEEAKEGISDYSTANSANNKKLHVVEITTGDDKGIYLIPSEEVQFIAKYSFNKGHKRPSATFTIDVQKDFEAPTREDLTVKTPELPSFELGDKDIKLNTPTVSNKYQDNIAYNITKVRIQHKDKKNTVYQELTNNDLTFDMTVEAFSRPGFDISNYETLAGTYEIVYTIVDAYGNERTETYKKENITISSNPTVYMSYDYTVTLESNKKVATGMDTSYAVDLKSEYTYNNIVVPAAYAEDKISSYDDLIIVRTLIDTEDKYNPYYIDNVKYSNGKLVPVSSSDNRNYAEGMDIPASNEIDEKVKVNQAVAFKFSDEDAEKMAGKTFILRYEVRSKNVKTRTGKLISDQTSEEYTFKVVESIEKGKDPIIKITNLSDKTAVKTNDEVKVEVSATDGKDSRLATRVYTIDGEISDLTAIDDLKTLIQTSVTEVLTKPETSNYSYGKCNVLDYDKFEEGITGTHSTFKKINTVDAKKGIYSFTANTAKTVVAVTVNDDGTVAVQTKVITIKNLADTVEPTYTIVDAKSFAKDDNKTTIHALTAYVGDTVYLPTIMFEDESSAGVAGDNSLALSAAYYIDSPLTEDGINFKYPENAVMFNNVISGASIKPTVAGTYTVVYTATDDAGNTSVVSFSFEVKEIIKTKIDTDITGEKEDGFELTADGAKANSGAIIKIDPSISKYDKETYTTGAPSIQMELESGNLYYEYLGDNQYQFFGIGEYKFRFSAGSGDTASGIQEYVIKINSVKLAWEDDEFGTVPITAVLDEEVFLPMPTTNTSAKISVKVTKGSKEIDVTYVNDGWTFVASEEGSYKVEYFAENENYVLDDNTIYTVNVGDNYKPKLNVSQLETLTQDIVYDGTNNIEYKLTIDSTNKKVYVDVISNGEKLIDHLDTGLSITDKNDAGDFYNNTSALWRTVDAKLSKGSETVESSEDYQWFITGTGEYTLTISAEDKNNVGDIKITFNVVRKTETENKNDTAVGIALIVVSLVVLAGVIGYFAFAGKKGKSLKSRKTKVTEVEVSEDEEVVEETKVEDTKVEEVKAEEIETEKVEEKTEAEAKEVEVEEKVEEPVETEEAKTEEIVEVETEPTTEEKSEESDSTDAE